MNSIFRFILLFCCFSVFCGQQVHAQLEGDISETSITNNQLPFTVTHYSTKDGLPQNQIGQILQRRDGELIIHTANGIVSFNGYRFKSVSTDKNYKKQAFKSLHYFKKSDILLGHDWYDDLLMVSPTYRKLSINGAKPMVCLQDRESLLIISITGDVFLYDPVKDSTKLLFKNRYIAIHPLSDLKERAVLKGKMIYVTDRLGLLCIDLEAQNIRRVSGLDCHELVLNPYNGLVYAILEHSIAIVRKDRLEHSFAIKTGTPHGRTTDAFFVDSLSLYLATNYGLIHISQGNTRHYTKADGIPSYGLLSMLYDSLNQCIFVGSTGQGLLKLQFKNNYPILVPFEEYYHSMGSVVHIPGKQIITAAGPFFYSVGKNGLRKVFSREEYNHSSLSEIDGNLYAGTWGSGVFIYKDFKLYDTLRENRQLPDGHIHASFKDSRGQIWVGTDHGLARGKKKQDMKPFLNKRIREGVYCFYELRDGRICIGTTGGGYIVRNDSILTSFHTSGVFKGREIRSFYEDSAGRIWIGSYSGGLYCYEKNVLTSINAMRNCMLFEDAFCIAKDTYGYLYMTSNKGLWRIYEKDLAAFYNKKISYLVPFHYTEESGFINTEFNGGFQNNFLKDGNNFLFPTIEGLVKTIPEKPAYSRLSPEIYSIRVNDTIVSGQQRKFERSTYSLQFDFQCVNFSQKNNVHFQHKLIGETNYEWSPPQKQTTVYLKMLPPGKYTFMVRAIDGFNDPKPYATSYTFEIKPYLYETTWFRILSVIFLTLLIILVVRIRVINNKKKIELREYYKRKISEVELNAIQAQLNPHFIFNCMNTIKYFILEKDFGNASTGLNKLSRLIRNSLENSEKMFIPLGQEMLFISNYLELEKMRLREHLSYTIHIGAGVDTNSLIPQLFIQPHVENAIKHGIANLENRQGILKIEIVQAGSEIICTVEDNGIGRNASSKLIRDTSHISKGTRLTEEKSQLLKQYYNYHCAIETIDLYGETGESLGTRIIISMPAYYKSGNILSL